MKVKCIIISKLRKKKQHLRTLKLINYNTLIYKVNAWNLLYVRME